ncbi:basic amino acid ABC transporter substrate-binding protein [Siminovitchia acidinfaciens]|uniref:Basic amino acid ABC transporter substrate-binding protein n=1 Tax=Siminovitchia acidinfaciens TaxID=2321395 RepID=A0A429XT34_9BACI|nr:basic amino acid ABC transporter substrate-binding protein [Siminovitchia acidinfaciens]RST70817.1 basic amino acid ABC transporter substrate-binding protein [Siminovitchia acidinfaciens]
MKKVSRLWSLSFLLLSLTVLLFGCGGGSKGSESPAGGESSDGDGKKKLIVGTDATWAPMEYMDSNGNIVGIDIDIVEAIADEAGFDVEFKNIGWEPLFPAVENGEVDFAVSSITITEERKKSFDFSDPYYIAQQVILVKEGSDIKSFQDLKDKKVSVQINSTGHIMLKEVMGKTSTKITAIDTLPFAIGELMNGNVDAAVGDNSAVDEYLKNNPNAGVKIIEDDSAEIEYYGLLVKKGNSEVLNLLNEGIQKIKESGKLKEITGFDVE